jgi:predicted nucleotidyltransferase
MQVRALPQMNMRALVQRIQPNASELAAARKHLITMRRRLASSFDIAKVIVIGSHARNTAIRWYSDLDVLAVLKRNEAKWGGSLVLSSTLLNRVKEDLQDRYVNTDVRNDCQAVVVGFSDQQQALDVVPALFGRFEGLRPVYMIPDGSGEWYETSPEAHDTYFKSANEQSGGKLKAVVQLLKWWKYSRAQHVPIQSFHVDLLMAHSGICIGIKPYTHCLYEAFKLLSDRECRGFQDPLGVAGTILAAQSEAQIDAANRAVAYALSHAQAALAAEFVKNFEEANRQWNIVFNDAF